MGELVGTLGIMEDITEQKRNEAIRQSQEKEISLYGSLMNHDIRNDLCIAMSYIDATKMLTSELNEDSIGFLESAIYTIERVSNLLAGIGQPADVVETELVALLERFAQEACMTNKGLTIRVLPDTNILKTKVAAGSLLALVFHNLFTNAVQHAGKNTNVEIVVTKEDDIAKIIYSDDGPGIPDTLRRSLFQRGVSIKKASGGLGLHLCREIMKIKGGSIELLPQEENQGASFLITLPLTPIS